MRHILSLVTGIVVAPLVWVLVAMGQGAIQNGIPAGNSTPKDLIVGLLVLVGVGLVAGFIASLRTSPVGAMFAGLIFVGASAYMYLDHARALEIFTTTWKVNHFLIDLASPLTSGVLAFAGGLLLMSVFSASRWRGRSAADDSDNWSPIPPEDNWSYR